MTAGLSPDQFSSLTEAVMTTEAVDAALELGVLERLEAGPVTLETLAEECDIDHQHARLLVAVLVGLGIAHPHGQGVYEAAMASFSQVAPIVMASGSLTQRLRSRAPGVAADTRGGAQTLYPDLLPYLAAAFQSAAEQAAESLGGDGLKILDLGAGAAPWTSAIATRHRSVEVTAVDLPDVIPVTRAAVSNAGVGDRFEIVAGDFFQIDLGEQAFDLAIAGGICHLFDEESNLLLLKSVRRAVAPAGKLAIIDVLPNERFDGPLPVLLYALGLISRTRGGSVHPFSTYVDWLRATGFSTIERIDLSERPPLSLITAHRSPVTDG